MQLLGHAREALPRQWLHGRAGGWLWRSRACAGIENLCNLAENRELKPRRIATTVAAATAAATLVWAHRGTDVRWTRGVVL